MRIGGLQKLTLLDFPGHTACTLFTSGCNFKCPFCHNASLVECDGAVGSIDENELFRFLEKRRGLLDGVAVTGGEPLLHADLPELLKKIKSYGYSIKLDTNGSFPDRLAEITESGLADYIAMDVKSSPGHYAELTGTGAYTDCVLESIRLLMNGKTPFEFRTTAVQPFHTVQDFEEIGKLISGAPHYFIQCFKDSGNILRPSCYAPDLKTLHSYLDAAKRYVPFAELRGV